MVTFDAPDHSVLDADPVAWHAMGVEEVVDRLVVDPAVGLSAVEARLRANRMGPNRLEDPPPTPRWRTFVEQFRDLLVLALVVGAVLAGAIGDLRDAAAIAVVLLCNASSGYLQARRAARSVAALRAMLASWSKVRRDGRVALVATDELVPGDVVLLDAGDRIPADGRVLEAWSAEVDESALTGESMPVPKDAEPALRADATLAARPTTVLMNTQLTKGRLVLVVTATGMATEVGRVAHMISAAGEGRTPLQQQLDGLGRRLALVSAAVVGLYVVLSLLRGTSPDATVISAVALLVAAIPEGLPAVVTLTLAAGSGRLARRGAIVKRLASVETLGATSVICTDKTGTLTLNEMTVRALTMPSGTATVSGAGYGAAGAVLGDVERAELTDLCRAAVLCNDSDVRGGVLLGDPTEGALVVLARRSGLDPDAVRAAHPRLAEVPFTSPRKLMATFNGPPFGRDVSVSVKGAPEVVLERCRWSGAAGVELDPTVRARLADEARRLAQQGLRVLAVARGDVDRAAVEIPFLADDERLQHVIGLTFLGLVGMADPPRPEVADAIVAARRAGVAVKIVTGDHVDTARALARELGIDGDAIDGAQLDALDDEALTARIGSLGVIARVAPHHKVRVVEVLRAGGAVVAMTGDGVNDAAALATADIGVAMGGGGTEVARQAAHVVLVDDNFATITGAVAEGRTIYANIVKFVRFQVATNIGALAALLGALAVNLPAPFNAIQLLWINLIMDGPPALALGLAPGTADEMDRPPRRRGADILDARRLRGVALNGVVMAAGTLAVLVAARAYADDQRALTLAFTTFVMFQVANALSVGDERRSLFCAATLRNRKLLGALAAIVVLQVCAVQLEVGQRLFSTVGMSPGDWCLAVLAASSLLGVEELRKARLTRAERSASA